jgi:putative holliday junction resolvase
MDALVHFEHEGGDPMSGEIGPILAVDPGEKRIGIAISDPSATLARPLEVIFHVSMKIDGAAIAALASENQVKMILVGLPMGSQNEEIPQTRHAKKLIESIASQTNLPVIGWDEWGSTQSARQVLIETGVSRSKRGGHQDALAASMILRSYLDGRDAQKGSKND